MRFKGFSPGIAGYPGFVRQNIHGCARSASTEIGGEVSRRVICQAWARSAKRQTACKPGSVPSATPPRGDLPGVTAIPLGRPSPGASCDRPERRRGGPPDICGIAPAMPAAPTWSCSRGGFPCRRRCRRRGALLPHHFTLAARPGTPMRVWRCAFCGTVPGVAPAGRYPAPYLRGARTFLSPRGAESGHPAVWHRRSGGPAAACQTPAP